MVTIDDIFGYLHYCKNQDTFYFDTKDQAESYAARLSQVITNECFDRRPQIVIEGCTVIVYLPKSMQQYQLPARKPAAVAAATKKSVRGSDESADEAETLYEELDGGGAEGPSGPEG